MTQSMVLTVRSYSKSSRKMTELTISYSVERFGQGIKPSKVIENIQVVIATKNIYMFPLDQSLQKIPALGSGGRINQA
jgi:hypothetical protein